MCWKNGSMDIGNNNTAISSPMETGSTLSNALTVDDCRHHQWKIPEVNSSNACGIRISASHLNHK